jgi:hypothetical protein
MAPGSILAEATLQLGGAIVEVSVRALGYGLLRCCLPRPCVSSGGRAALIAGILGWLGLFIVGYELWHWASGAV